MNPEKGRLKELKGKGTPWRKWGPYLTERQWGTVREDYSPDGSAWNYITHDMARSKAYRWGEEGIAGISDDLQFLCFSVAFWNGQDPILKERLFGLTNMEGNHGEDVKEYYYYLDNTPTHSYMKMLYKYPQSEFPYSLLKEESKMRSKEDPEFELIDTGIFNEDRYFDVFVEYAKYEPEDILIRITAINRRPEDALLHILPHVWFRNTWSWGCKPRNPAVVPTERPYIKVLQDGVIEMEHSSLGIRRLYYNGAPELLFCDNETNVRRLYGVTDVKGFFKDGINNYIIDGSQDAVNPDRVGTKLALNYRTSISAGGEEQILLRLSERSLERPFHHFDEIFQRRLDEADDFYAELQSKIEDHDARNVQRQALAGILWTKQFYYYDVSEWLDGDPGQPSPPPARQYGRNHEWQHLNNTEILSMPDKWEYPWYASWDLAFHCIALALIDPEFAKEQLVLLTREWYMHPNGQFPACEWSFGDVNPPVHAWVAWRVFQIDRAHHRKDEKGDLHFLQRIFHKLMLNFTWWVNRKDIKGRNVFQGGFLGLDNIGVFDRSAPLPTGGYITQSDGTSWMAMYCLNLMRIALELSQHNHIYEDVATKFFEHFLYIARAMYNIADQEVGLWDEEDEFYYDVLNFNGKIIPIKIHSMVGLIPLFAVETLEPDFLEKVPDFSRRLEWFLDYRPDLADLVSRWYEPGCGERRLLSLLRGHRMKMLLKRALDENEFLSDYGIRALSKYHQEHPYVFSVDDNEFTVKYEPAESSSNLFGGNSNWRGPIWFPLNYLIIESLQKFHHYYSDDFKIECPTHSGNYVTINDAARELTRRLTRIFLKDENEKRAVYNHNQKFQTDPHFRDHILFYECFHGDTGWGVGASHQTGWTGLIAKLLQPRRGE
jgi:hypothetical protein